MQLFLYCMNKKEKNHASDYVLKLPDVVVELWRSQQKLSKHFSHTGLKFTLDGRIIGDIAEAIALHHFDLQLPSRRTNGVDALTKKGETVQIKATSSAKSGPAFSPGTGIADYLIFFQLDFSNGLATVVYNGLEKPVRTKLLPKSWTGTKVISLKKLRELGNELGISNALPLKVM